MFDRDEKLEQEARSAFRNEIEMRFDDWKKGNLLRIALETMPQQVKTENVIDNIIKLDSAFRKKINDVYTPAPPNKKGRYVLFL